MNTLSQLEPVLKLSDQRGWVVSLPIDLNFSWWILSHRMANIPGRTPSISKRKTQSKVEEEKKKGYISSGTYKIGV